MSCPTLDVLAAYCTHELSDADTASLEDHYFVCGRCAGLLERMRGLVDRLHTLIPHVLTPERRRRLEATGQPLAVERLEPGERRTITFRPGTEVGFWVMHAPVSEAERVDFELSAENGTRLLAIADVPFDRDREELVLACRSAYRDWTPTPVLLARIRATDASGRTSVSDYILNHVFDSP